MKPADRIKVTLKALKQLKLAISNYKFMVPLDGAQEYKYQTPVELINVEIEIKEFVTEQFKYLEDLLRYGKEKDK